MNGLDGPLVEVGREFRGRDVLDGRDKAEWSGGAVDIGLQAGFERDKPGGGEFVEIPLVKGLANAAQAIGLELAAVLVVHEALFANRLGFDGLKVLDFELALAAPSQQGVFADVEFGGNAVEAPALGAELDETVTGILIFHSIRSFYFYRSCGSRHTVSGGPQTRGP